MIYFQHARLHSAVLTAQAYVAHVLATLHGALLSGLGALAFLLSERLFAFALAPTPESSTVSPLWLSSVLHARGWIAAGVTVRTAELQSLQANRGLTGTTLRLAVTYNTPHGATPGPASFIIKRRFDGNMVRSLSRGAVAAAWRAGGR